MGGPGSGWWYRSKRKVTADDQKKIDIRYMKKHGLLKPGCTGIFSWRQGDVSTGNVEFIVGKDHMTLVYRARSVGIDCQRVKQRITLDLTPCNFGGTRRWFLCPCCGKRVAALYGADIRFLCRHCYGLSYESRNENYADRMRRKARKLRKRLEASDDLFKPVLFKPKGMHQKTFDRLRQEELEANQAVLLSMVKELRLCL